MIRTQQRHIPWRWVILLTTTTAVVSFIEKCSGSALTFSIRKFTADPALIVFIGSVNIAFNFLVAPFVAWKSDRIWTRWGRRKPFMLVGFALIVPSLLLVPLMPGLALLAAIVVVWQFAMDFGYTGPWSPLLYETVPSHQRGRMVVIKNVITYPLRFLYNLVLIGQFDRVYQFRLGSGHFTITGEFVIYGVAALLALLVLANLMFNVRETPPQNPQPREDFRPLRYFKEVFGERQFRLIYLLLICGTFMTAGLGQLGVLLMTEQWGYTKQQYGNIANFELLFSLCVIMPVIGLVIDRFDRFRIFQFGMIVSTLHPLVFWAFVKYIAPNQVPSVYWLVGFHMFIGLVDGAAMLALEPLFFDMVPRDKMGTMNSGFLLVRGALAFFMANAVGLWVKYYSAIFSPGKIDYMSGYLWVALVGVLGVIGSFYFDGQRRKGRVVFYTGTKPTATGDGEGQTEKVAAGKEEQR